uniref:Enhanced disease resistance 4-like N-terminal domain-containing protein n=1 Tax=Rhizophora mucronata TaxID=61149 RepID=A0A2P2JUC9_RHIMU
MISGKNAKVRLVICPKCRQILPELPDVPVYECGVCHTRLQGTSYKICTTF